MQQYIKMILKKLLAIIARKEFKFDIIFIDPPYLKNLCEMNLKLVEKINILRNSGIIVIHHHKKEILPEKFKNIYLSDKRKYGDAIISMYSIKSSSPDKGEIGGVFKEATNEKFLHCIIFILFFSTTIYAIDGTGKFLLSLGGGVSLPSTPVKFKDSINKVWLLELQLGSGLSPNFNLSL